MPAATDFRTKPFNASNVDLSGKNIGKTIYWKLYSIENIARIIIHSVLLVQISPEWWAIAVDENIKQRAARLQENYKKKPWHSTPGKHAIYYIYLSDLNEIMRVNSHLFRPIIDDVDQWIAKIEQIRLPRNVVGHMNWPSQADRQRINVVHADIHELVRHLANSTLQLAVP